jgi:hypothetical protein
MAANNIIVKVPTKLKAPAEKVLPLVETFIKTCQPLESQSLYLLVDTARVHSFANAIYAPIH